MLWTLSYVSLSRVPKYSHEMLAICRSALRNNARDDITGALYIDETSFYQVVEGERRVLRDLLAALREDPRHTALRLIEDHPIGARRFGAWSMRLVDAGGRTGLPTLPAKALYAGDIGAARQVERRMLGMPSMARGPRREPARVSGTDTAAAG